MPGDRCAVSGITKATDPNVSFHRIFCVSKASVAWVEEASAMIMISSVYAYVKWLLKCI